MAFRGSSPQGLDDPALLQQMLLSSPHELSLLKERNPPLAEALLSGDLGKQKRADLILHAKIAVQYMLLLVTYECVLLNAPVFPQSVSPKCCWSNSRIEPRESKRGSDFSRLILSIWKPRQRLRRTSGIEPADFSAHMGTFTTQLITICMSVHTGLVSSADTAFCNN